MGCILSVPFGAENARNLMTIFSSKQILRSIENSSEAASNKENWTENLRKFFFNDFVSVKFQKKKQTAKRKILHKTMEF